MIAGVGTDIIEIERIKKASEKNCFLSRCFTDTERRYATAPEKLAGLFAAKEAAVKALGEGFKRFLPADVEIIHDKNGKPSVKIKGLEEAVIHVSISHCRQYAVAFAVYETEESHAFGGSFANEND
ncbi:MAG: holo-ACP synthase [Defluviitaleaceae bacterium]|nr:holo-ACP synthase [Defluviitaleaceae bacterium]